MPALNTQNIQTLEKNVDFANQLKAQAQNAADDAAAKLELAKFNFLQQQLSQAHENFNIALNNLKARKDKFSPEQQTILNDLINQASTLIKECEDHQRINELTKIVITVNDILDHKKIDPDAIDLLNSEKNRYSFFDKTSNRVLVGIAYTLIGLLLFAAIVAAIFFTSTLVPGNPGILLPFMMGEMIIAVLLLFGTFAPICDETSFLYDKPNSLAQVLNQFSDNFVDSASTSETASVDEQANGTQLTF